MKKFICSGLKNCDNIICIHRNPHKQIIPCNFLCTCTPSSDYSFEGGNKCIEFKESKDEKIYLF